MVMVLVMMMGMMLMVMMVTMLHETNQCNASMPGFLYQSKVS